MVQGPCIHILAIYLYVDLPEDLVHALDKKLSKLDEVLEKEVRANTFLNP